jgi:hypothetical protein
MEISEPDDEFSTRPTDVPPARRVSIFEHMNINAFWIANNIHWQA